jgi:hypothetical protein
MLRLPLPDLLSRPFHRWFDCWALAARRLPGVIHQKDSSRGLFWVSARVDGGFCAPDPFAAAGLLVPCGNRTSCAETPSVPGYLLPFTCTRITPHHIVLQTFPDHAYLSHPVKFMWNRGHVTVIDRSLLDKTRRPEELSIEKTWGVARSAVIKSANADGADDSVSRYIHTGRNLRDKLSLCAHMSALACGFQSRGPATGHRMAAQAESGSREIRYLVGRAKDRVIRQRYRAAAANSMLRKDRWSNDPSPAVTR